MEFESEQFVRPLIWLKNQDRKALRKDLKFLSLELQGEKGPFYF